MLQEMSIGEDLTIYCIWFFLQFSLQDNVQDLRQIVLDRPESCYRTCFSLQIDGVRLDDFAELNMIEGLKDEATIKVVEGMVHMI